MKILTLKLWAILVIPAALVTASTQAADDTWDGDTNALWSDSSNWVGGSVPGAADTATFSSGIPTNTTIDLGAGITVNGIVFGAGPSITIGTGAVNSQTLTRTNVGGSGNVFVNSPVDHLFNAGIVLGDTGEASTSFTFQNQGTTNLLTFAGDITNNGNSQTFNKQGNGTIVLSGNNSYGNTVIENGTLRLGSNTALGINTSVTVRSADAASGIDNDVTLDIAGNSIDLGTGGLILGNTSAGTYGPGQTPQVIDSVGGGLIRIQSVKYENGSAGNLNGTATISSDLTWNSNRAFNIEDGGSDVDLEFSGSIIDDGLNPNALIKQGTGKLLLTGGSKNAVNTILHRGGTVAFTEDNQLSSGDVVVGYTTTTATLEYVGTGGTTDNRIDVGGGSGVTHTGGSIILANGTGALTFTNAAFNDDVAQDVTIQRDITFGGTNTGDNTVSGAIVNNNSGAEIGVIKQDAGKWILNGNNTYTGDTSVNAGRLDLGGTNTSSITVATGATLGGEGSTTGNLTFGAGSILAVTGNGNAFGTTGTLDTSAGVSVLVEEVSVAGAFSILNYGIVGSSTISDFSINAGGVQASSRGATYADTGTSFTLDLGYEDRTWNGSANNIWDAGNVANTNWDEGDTVFYDGDFATFTDTGAGTIVLGGNVTAGGATFINDTTAYTVNDNGGGEVLTINSGIVFKGNADATVNAVIAGLGSLTLGDENDGVSDGANLTLTAANTYAGGTNITEGQLRITDSDALGTGAVSITDAGSNQNSEPSLELDANNLNVANDITITNDGFNKRIRFDIAGTGNTSEISGDVTLNEVTDRITSISAGAGETLTLSGRIRGAGFLTATGSTDGILKLTNDASDHTGGVLVRTNSILEFTSIADSGVNSAVGAGSLIHVGYRGENGTLRYSGDGHSTNRQIQIGEDYTGTTIRTGSATLESSGSGAIVFTNAAFNNVESAAWVGDRSLTLGGTNTALNEIQGVIADNINTSTSDGAVSVIKDDAGTWKLSGANTYTGSTTVNDGTLIFANKAARSAGTTVTAGAGGTVGLGVGGGGVTDYSSTDVADLFNTNTLAGFNLDSASGVALDTTAGDFTVATGLTAARDLTIYGGNNVTFTGSNSFTGTTNVGGGTIVVDGSIASNVIVEAGGEISGSGSTSGTVSIAGTISPGNSPGTLSTGAQTWLDGADYNLEILDAAGIAGTGYDTMSIAGNLDLTNLTTSGFSINLWSLSSIGPDVDGDANNFLDGNNYQWTIASATSVTGFDAADFAIFTAANNGTAGFSNSFTGSFNVSADANNLYLNYAAVPEPTTFALLALGLASLLSVRRQVRR